MGQKLPGYRPGLAIVQIGGREDSNVYIRMKLKNAEAIGIKAIHVQMPRSTTEVEVLQFNLFQHSASIIRGPLNYRSC